MTLGLEEFLKELRADNKITAMQFTFKKLPERETIMLALCTGEMFINPYWSFYSFTHQQDFKSILKQIKKEMKNQSKG
jgi:hypothetical protein